MNKQDESEQSLKIDFIKELMYLPLDKKTNTIKLKDINKIIHTLAIQLENKNPNIMETLEIMSDKKLMERFKKAEAQQKKDTD